MQAQLNQTTATAVSMDAASAAVKAAKQASLAAASVAGKAADQVSLAVEAAHASIELDKLIQAVAMNEVDWSDALRQFVEHYRAIRKVDNHHGLRCVEKFILNLAIIEGHISSNTHPKIKTNLNGCDLYVWQNVTVNDGVYQGVHKHIMVFKLSYLASTRVVLKEDKWLSFGRDESVWKDADDNENIINLIQTAVSAGVLSPFTFHPDGEGVKKTVVLPHDYRMQQQLSIGCDGQLYVILKNDDFTVTHEGTLRFATDEDKVRFGEHAQVIFTGDVSHGNMGHGPVNIAYPRE